MNRLFPRLALVTFLVMPYVTLGQSPQLPRDANKLISRAQIFWSRLAAGQKAGALELILPEKKEAFLSSPPLSIVSATIVGLGLTNDPQHAKVTVRIAMISPESSSKEGTSWTWDENWVWRGNNWYADMGDPRELLRVSGNSESRDKVEQMQREIEGSLSLGKDKVDLGTLIRGQILTLEVPVNYTGKLSLTAEPVIPSTLITPSSTKDGVTMDSNRFTLSINTTDYDGDFSFPVRIRFRHEAAAVERTLMVTGKVYMPLTFRQVPEAGPLSEGRSFSVFVKNHSPEPIPVQMFLTDDKVEVIDSPDVLAADSESEVVLKLMPGRIPDRLDVILANPMQGVSHFSFQIKH